MNFETAREKDLYIRDKEKAYHLERAILDLLKSEGVFYFRDKIPFQKYSRAT